MNVIGGWTLYRYGSGGVSWRIVGVYRGDALLAGALDVWWASGAL